MPQPHSWSNPSPGRTQEINTLFLPRVQEPASTKELLQDTIQEAIINALEDTLSCTHMPRIALTFDDGPLPGFTDEILGILAERGVPATFFLIGRQVRAHPHLVQRIVEEGHEIAVHSDTHADLSRLSSEGQQREIQRGWEALTQVAPSAPVIHWRAPYGALEGVGMHYPRSLGLEHAGWSIDTLDWQRPELELWRDRILGRARDGSIVLMHDHALVSRKGLGAVIESLWEMGFVFRTVSGLTGSSCYDDTGTLHPK